MPPDARRKLTPPELAARYGVSTDKVHGWIRSGELRAVNLAASPTGRPRWAIDPADVEAFERRRAAAPPAEKPAGRRRKRDPEVIAFF